MPATTEAGISARKRVMGMLGSLALTAPEGVIDDADWDGMSRRHAVPWTEDEVAEQTRMTREQYDAIWEEHRMEQRRMNAEAEMAEIDKWQMELDERTERACVPERYRNTPLDLTMLEQLSTRVGAYIYGNQGCGKTWRACTMLRGWVSRNRGHALFTTSVEMLQQIAATYTSQDSALTVLERYGSCDLLVIDDIGKENPTSNSLMMLWFVMNMRYERNLPTIYTSQYNLNQLRARLSEKGDADTASSIVSRIRETCSGIDMTGPDHRVMM